MKSLSRRLKSAAPFASRPRESTRYALSRRGGKSVRVAPKIRARENRPSDLTLDYLRGWHYQAIRAAAASRSPMMLSLRHRRFVIGLEVLAWAGATKWLVSPVRQSLLSSSSSPRPHLLVLFSSTVVNRTSSRDGCIKALCNDNLRYICQRRARPCDFAFHLPEESFPKEGSEFFRWRHRHNLNSRRSLSSCTSCSWK